MDQLLSARGLSLKTQSRVKAETARAELFGYDCILARPTTFMNESGGAVRAVADYYEVATEHILVAYDELDLPPGVVRLKQGGGHGGHNGLRDIFRHLPEPGFLRLRIGIGHPGHKDAVTPYVLGRPPVQIRMEVENAIGRAIAVIPDILSGQVAAAQKALHTEA
jgi:PTH1 family peptidyl-tRNA hydrolase